jgi:ABC-type glycerol-3-phosphate transport system permease component
VTFDDVRHVWVEDGFRRYAVDATIVTAATVTVSLAIGRLAGHVPARCR